eukprot:7312291-Prymnesium_polylepis.2
MLLTAAVRSQHASALSRALFRASSCIMSMCACAACPLFLLAIRETSHAKQVPLSHIGRPHLYISVSLLRSPPRDLLFLSTEGRQGRQEK